MPTAMTPMTAVSGDLAPLLDVYPPESAAAFVVALAGDVHVFRSASAALRYDRDRLASDG